MLRKPLAALAFGLILSTSVHASADKAIKKAETARQSAAQIGYEWRDTAKLIKKAKELAAAGKSKQAVALAKKAKKQSQDAIDQYHSEKKRLGM
jgi:LPS sulfotransferase NodH